ncbi:MAG: bacillithiol biosynthesis cysteine-adding enzyme BshC [Cyclobacteriaceae bacterium]|nr:bacillithiol biosynthesis cysteine-adding enzyme BshC [Cyclobacteriaceae bacterium]
MRLQKLDFSETHSFSTFFLDYIQKKNSLTPFYSRFPEAQNFKLQLEEKEKSFPDTHRKVLSEVLQKQYDGFTITENVKENIASLQHKNTFTITTGHQQNIFTGPLYFIYKIVTVINSCVELKKQYPEYNFVPVYWMASEDHDYDEIKYFRLYGKKHTWVTDQTGAVGRFDPKSIEKLFSEIPGEVTLFKEAYLKHSTLSAAVRYYVNELFGKQGLVVIDADDHQLKTSFIKVMEADLFDHTSKKLVEEQNKQLESLGYNPQVFARDINFFYLDKNLRSRIELVGDTFHVVDTNIKFTKAEIQKLLLEEPEKFSPNVILRPLYQEFILPNLAYAGGPAEVVYWLQLKKVFNHFSIPFPILLPRNFALIIDKPVSRKFEKTGLDYQHLFEEKNYLFNQWIVKHSIHDLSLGKEMKSIRADFDAIKERASQIDTTLIKFIDAQAKRAINSLERTEHKLLRAEKRLHADKLRQLESVKDELFPNGSPQERVDNFLNFYQQDPQFIQHLLDTFEPFDFRFNLLFY